MSHMPHFRTLGSPFSHSLRAICTVLLDPRDPLLHSERTQGFAADPDYWKGEVFAYVGSIQNLKDLKEYLRTADLGSARGRARAHLGSLKHPNRVTLHWRAKRDPEAKMLSLQSSLRRH